MTCIAEYGTLSQETQKPGEHRPTLNNYIWITIILVTVDVCIVILHFLFLFFNSFSSSPDLMHIVRIFNIEQRFSTCEPRPTGGPRTSAWWAATKVGN